MTERPDVTAVERCAASEPSAARSAWAEDLSRAIRDPRELLSRLGLPPDLASSDAHRDFRQIVPESFVARMVPGDADDPLLRQVLPIKEETAVADGFVSDPVDDLAHRPVDGVVHKYPGRVLLIASGSCAINCRYCFRRHYPYGEEPRTLSQWQAAADYIAGDETIREVILSGGDPLLLTDRRLAELIDLVTHAPHVRRLRIHSRLPIVLPARVTDSLLRVLRESGVQPWLVVHANHPAEIADDCVDALARSVAGGLPVLNQSVLLRGVNDCAETLAELSQRLIDVGVQPYYLNQLDRVRGAAHFAVCDAVAKNLVENLRRRLPGYAVPTLVRDISGEVCKTVLR